MKRRTLITSALAAVALAAGVAIAPTVAEPASADDPITFAVMGDSLSANSDSWLHQLNDSGLQYAGGYQKAGLTTNGVYAAMSPGSADVLVIMLGTNDVKYGFTPEAINSRVEDIVTKFGGGKTVLISALPPSDITDDETTHVDRQVKGVIANRELLGLAARHGWLYADPFSFKRAWWNGWGGGGSTDKTHPTAQTSLGVSQRMSVYIRQAAVAGNIGKTSPQ